MEEYTSEISLFAFDFAPVGWAKCEGQLLQVINHLDLYSLLGNRFGGDGVKTFALPDLRGKVIIGSGAGYPAFISEGSSVHQLTIQEMPKHRHGAVASSENADAATPMDNFWAADTGYTQTTNSQMSTKALSNTGGNQPHDNMSPYLSLNYCICLKGIHPTESFNDDEEFTGVVKALCTPLVPNNWLFCDGREVPVARYANLFSIIGYTYGGSKDTFCLPDLRGRAAVNFGETEELTSYKLGEKAGEKEVKLTTPQLPRHRHGTNAALAGNTQVATNSIWANEPKSPPLIKSYATNKGKGAIMNTNAIGEAGGDAAHNNMMPFLSLNFYINAGGYAPENP
ncbi:MAG: tail fiber protein [Bergeyella sp.]